MVGEEVRVKKLCLLVLVVLAITMTACGTSTASPKTPRSPTSSTGEGLPSTTTTPPSAFGGVDRSNATAVAVAMIDATFTSNTTTDTSQQDAIVRSAIWYTPPAAANLRSQAPPSSPGAEWIAWTAHHATTTVTTTLNHDSGAPSDTATASYRQFTVEVTPHGDAGWTSPPDQYTCFVSLARTTATGPWQVASLQNDQ
jgi:hypothetical protein